ncbi:MAG: ribonuclease HII [Henriciella sp.]|jgi:ribonuclease HII|uniref:ribonuclease HII n=1 Tax=Henriciella sp. TaxID=1968823 RepID=UPI000C11696F|nr:ribonuclease HII [Henriciella sp.]MAN74564.1 ribonuclease HII [Henriciella sp.]MBF32676.1 ribonuclease HII [Hyphomonadaceae bacterium]MBK74154.1 ribonuclease HII [Henriciella sp.]PHR81851.1 MAG: ribonuclease HII [Henriciella sp.]|tara:strand:- start:2709 stop:3275 length:567 start_codon:yes stop_codon:yes gene_type:complete
MICGVDEAGRGPWAGPVTAGAVILDPAQPIEGLTDSKKLNEAHREALYPEIRAKAVTFGIGWASPAEIDRLNIREATFLAMTRAIAIMGLVPGEIIIDGNCMPKHLPCPGRAIVKGDLTEPAISAASILAKVARDRAMVELCHRYPGYGFSQHKGYGTPGHSNALQELGPCGCHRRSFAPVARALSAA